MRIMPISLKEAKASGFLLDAENVGGAVWTGKRSGRDNGVPQEMKKRWIYHCGKENYGKTNP